MARNGMVFPVIRAGAVVVGSGCAGLSAALELNRLGVDALLVTEGMNMGASRNTGSDKQTYYKLSLAGDEADSVLSMAEDLFAGGGMDGDIALCQAAGSARAFLRLCELGVPFPTDPYGQYAGYQTDHDVRRRATSAGPLTSRYMTEALEKAVHRAGVRMLDGVAAVDLLQQGGRVRGLIAMDILKQREVNRGLRLIIADAVVLATGGSAICYRDSVFPESQSGMTGMALCAGAVGANLDQWQYGLASVKFRWNVSGTYQQVMPRYLSVGAEGDEEEFLSDALGDARAANLTFLKGYQWPFDAARAGESTLVDLLVHNEIHRRGRRVYMDFRHNPRVLAQGFEALVPDARAYLEKSGALQQTPIERLRHMNPQAIQLYMDNGIDLAREPLEVAVCAQHMNGGLLVDSSWQTTLPGLYAVGECAGTFGSRRPGGSALNAGQVGSLRAAEHIALSKAGLPPADEAAFASQAAGLVAMLDAAAGNEGSCLDTMARFQAEMSRHAAHLRDLNGMVRLAGEVAEALDAYERQVRPEGRDGLYHYLKTRDMLRTQSAMLSAMIESAQRYGTRGAALVDGAESRDPGANLLLETRLENGSFVSSFRPAKPIPKSDLWFENVWRQWRARHGISDNE
ncbi:MAG: FAD-binding protein [Clostridiales bacterium]|nr:FAD-binding protein [Clostridiales bacterium]